MRNGPSSTVRRRDVTQHQIEQRRASTPWDRPGSPPSSPAWRSRRGSGNRAAPRDASSAANRSNTSLTTSVRPRVRAVDLVDGDDRLEADLQRLGDHELGLRQRTLGGIDQHDRAVHHVEDALDLAAEVGMARRVDDVDAGCAPQDRRDLGQDGDAALALEVIGIDRPFGHALVLAERARLLQQPVDQVVLPWSTWAMMATLRRFMKCL